MKRVIVAMGIMVLFAAQASALDAIPGGYVYWNGRLGNPVTKLLLVRTELDCNANVVGTPAVNFDNVLNINTYTSWPSTFWGRNVEVLDPRSAGGSGNLLLAAYANLTPPSGGFTGYAWQAPCDTLKINPTTLSHTVIVDGALPGITWDSRQQYTALAAPADWIPGKPSNGLSLALVRGIWSGNVAAVYDTNINGVIDNVSAEGQWFVADSTQVADVEFGLDKAIYRAYRAGTYLDPTVEIKRTGKAGVTTNYLTHVVADGMGSNSFTGGIAVGPGRPTNATPIVYVFTRDNDASLGQRPAIFALQDSNGDNVITLGTDTIAKVWVQGQAGIDTGNSSSYDMLDLEIFVDPSNGKRTLFFNTYYNNNLYALTLADNGLAVSGNGKAIAAGINQSAMGSDHLGFELDMNAGAAIPEPTTLLLLGTGALGALGWLRRRRMR